jgi:spore germination protein YaaH
MVLYKVTVFRSRGNHQLKYNKNTKILGLILDEQLNFNNHIEYIIKRVKRSLDITREIKGIAKPNLAGMFLGWSSTKLLFFVPVGYSI